MGEKTAAKWVREFGSLRRAGCRRRQVKGKVGEALREHLADVIRNRRLTELVRTVSLDVSVDELARQQWDRDEVHALFDDLQFTVLRDRLFATVAAPEPEAEQGFDLAVTPARRGRARAVAGRARTRRHARRRRVSADSGAAVRAG